MERFKKGTKVVCVKSYPRAFTRGRIYECRDNNGGIVKNDAGRNTDGFSYNWSLFEKYFIPVSELEPFAVIAENLDEGLVIVAYQFAMCGEYWPTPDKAKTLNYPAVFYFHTKQKSSGGPKPSSGHTEWSRNSCEPTYKTLTFEQFKNNEHLMNTKLSETVSCRGGDVLEVSPDFVKEAHKAACSDWKKKIEEQFPSLFPPTYQLGDKFKIDGGNQIYLLSQADGKVCLINLHTGNAHTKSFNVGDLRKISHTEIKNSFGYNVTLTKV